MILTTSMSLDGRCDIERPGLLTNRLEDYRRMELRGEVDAILTSSMRLVYEDTDFPTNDAKKNPTVVVVDKEAELNPKSNVLKREGRVMLVTCKKAHKSRVRRLEDSRLGLVVCEYGEHAVNLEDMLWELGRGGMNKILLEGDQSLNMRMFNYGLVNEMYVLVAPVIMGGDYISVFDGNLERRKGLQLNGIIQYGDHLLLHYLLVNPKNRD